MLKKIKLIVALTLCICVSSCASYTYNNNMYGDPTSALNAQAANLSEILNQITPESEPVAQKAVVIIPDYATIADKSITKGRIANVEAVDYVSKVTQNDLKFMVETIRKYNLIRNIEVKESASPEKTAQSLNNDIVIYYKTSNKDDQGWCLVSPNHSAQELKFDTNIPVGIARTKHWLSNLKQTLAKL